MILTLDSGNLMDSRSFSAIANVPNISAVASTDPNPLDFSAIPSYFSASTSSSISTNGNGTGLQAQYYQGKNFTDLKASQVDSTINFNWANSAPNTMLGSDNYSIRWAGQVQPKFSDTYTFYTRSDDGIRLWVNGQLLINHWSDHKETEDAGSITLRAGEKYDIQLEYYENTGSSMVQLLWSSPNQPKEIVPQSQLYATRGMTSTATPPALPVTVTIDWKMVEGSTTSGFGLNAFQGFRPDSANDWTYQSNMSFMNPGFIRFHNGSAMEDARTSDGLIDTARRTWDIGKVQAGLAASISTFGSDQPQRMLNIPTWPAWMDANNDGFLDRDQVNNFAQLCADLVKIVNVDLRLNVKYWEVTNEKDDQYFTQFRTNGGWGGLKDASQPDRLNELVDIYNAAAVAMKRADPTIMVGGPALARADLQPFYIPFIQGTVNNLDFFTYHVYATGSASTPDADVYKSTEVIGSHTASIVQALKNASPNRYIPAMLDEYNISWTWETRDPRMTNHKGVVFDALSIARALKNGAAATFAWNEKDGIYGKMDDQKQLRPAGTFFHLVNTFLEGDRVASTTTHESAVTTLAVKNDALQQKSYMIINHSSNPQRIQVNFTGWQPAQQRLDEYSLSASGYTAKSLRWDDISQGMIVPADSVTLVTLPNP